MKTRILAAVLALTAAGLLAPAKADADAIHTRYGRSYRPVHARPYFYRPHVYRPYVYDYYDYAPYPYASYYYRRAPRPLVVYPRVYRPRMGVSFGFRW